MDLEGPNHRFGCPELDFQGNVTKMRTLQAVRFLTIVNIAGAVDYWEMRFRILVYLDRPGTYVGWEVVSAGVFANCR